MTKKITGILLFILLTVLFHISYGQNKKIKAEENAENALKLEEDGKFDAAIRLLKVSQKLDPEEIEYPYEIAYAYYSKKSYKQAIKYLLPLTKHKDVMDLVYQLLGNCYDNIGKTAKAKETYDAGLKIFPNSGILYSEKGIVQMGRKDYENALVFFEKGIEVEPKFASNYYLAAKIYCNTTEKVWGIIYGELFMNLERKSLRTSSVSKLLYDTYKSQIKFTSDSTISVSFSKNATISINDLKDSGNIKLPFGTGIYEPNLLLSLIGEKTIDVASLVRIRTNFIENYFKNNYNIKYPNILFDYQNEIMKAGHIEAYNHWILMSADENSLPKWKEANKEKWDAFLKWFWDNKIKVDSTHKFYRSQY